MALTCILDNVRTPNEMMDIVLGDLLPDLDQSLTELLDSLKCNLAASVDQNKISQKGSTGFAQASMGARSF